MNVPGRRSTSVTVLLQWYGRICLITRAFMALSYKQSDCHSPEQTALPLEESAVWAQIPSQQHQIAIYMSF